MADFEHDATFVASEEASGRLELERYEAAYQQLFSEALEDGVITQDEREKLQAAARNLGLDPDRLLGLEEALRKAYEAHHGNSVLDTTRMFAPRETTPVPGPDFVPSVSPPEPKRAEVADEEVAALRSRVAYLEERVKELENQLEEERNLVTYEVDFSDVDAPVPSSALDDPGALHRRLRHDPRDVTTLNSLFHAYAGQPDRQFCVAQALVFLDEADQEQRSHYQTNRPEGLISPKAALDAASWRRLLYHPEDDELTSDILAIIVKAVLLAHSASLQKSGSLPKLEADQRLDPETSTVQAARCFSWAAKTYGMSVPPLFASPQTPATVAMVPTVPPALALGKASLSGRTAPQLAFVAGQQLAYFRPERFVRLLIPSIVDLQDLYLAALLIGNASLPLNAEVRGRVDPIASAIRPLLSGAEVDNLRRAYARFVEHGGVANLQRWGHAADLTAARAGFVLAGDLTVAADMVPLLGLDRDVIDDLLVFVTSDRYANLRDRLGISIG